jgi:hypothetical protein
MEVIMIILQILISAGVAYLIFKPEKKISLTHSTRPSGVFYMDGNHEKKAADGLDLND